jgi:hypothetical protein
MPSMTRPLVVVVSTDRSCAASRASNNTASDRRDRRVSFGSFSQSLSTVVASSIDKETEQSDDDVVAVVVVVVEEYDDDDIREETIDGRLFFVAIPVKAWLCRTTSSRTITRRKHNM